MSLVISARRVAQAVVLTVALALGGASLLAGAVEVRAQGQPICHYDPEICDTWQGDGCGGECVPGEGICCQPDDGG